MNKRNQRSFIPSLSKVSLKASYSDNILKQFADNFLRIFSECYGYKLFERKIKNQATGGDFSWLIKHFSSLVAVDARQVSLRLRRLSGYGKKMLVMSKSGVCLL